MKLTEINCRCFLQVSLSMLEIYNEQVRDLLNAKTMTVKGGLKVRQHPSKGFYGKYKINDLCQPEALFYQSWYCLNQAI